jgi:hypothetical protein
MAFAITPVAAKDGNQATITGGVDFVDTSGSGAGPWIITKATIDPAGVNVQYVLSNNAAKTDLSSIAGTTAVNGHGTAAGALRVELPTDGTGVVNALQSGTWTVQPGNTANTVAWKVDGSAVTQPVSGTVTSNQGGAPWSDNITQFGGVALSTGTGAGGTGIPRVTVSNDSAVKVWDGTNTTAVKAASTQAVAADPSAVFTLSPNSFGVLTSGTAGSASAQVVSVQGIASMTPVQVSPSASSSGGYSYNNISSDTTTVVKSGAGFLHSIVINTLAATGTATVYDNTAGSGTKIATIATAAMGTLLYDIAFGTGLTIVTATAAPDLTVCYK